MDVFLTVNIFGRRLALPWPRNIGGIHGTRGSPTLSLLSNSKHGCSADDRQLQRRLGSDLRSADVRSLPSLAPPKSRCLGSTAPIITGGGYRGPAAVVGHLRLAQSATHRNCLKSGSFFLTTLPLWCSDNEVALPGYLTRATLVEPSIHRCSIHCPWGAESSEAVVSESGAPSGSKPVERVKRCTCECLITYRGSSAS
jgi:hypothetical protein